MFLRIKDFVIANITYFFGFAMPHCALWGCLAQIFTNMSVSVIVIRPWETAIGLWANGRLAKEERQNVSLCGVHLCAIFVYSFN